MRTLRSRGARALAVGLVAALCMATGARGGPQDRGGPDAEQRITILQTTDLHHHANGAEHVGLEVDPVGGTSSVGAYSRIAAYVNYVRSSTRHPVILVDSGDWTMGTLYDLTLGKRPLALEFLDLMRYDCVTLGNHEFDYGPKGLAQILGNAQGTFAFRTPIVASNMNLGGDADLAHFFGRGKAIQATRVQELHNGLRVGYIGLMGRTATFAAPTAAPVTFTDVPSHYAAIQALVDGLRKNDRADIVVALSHSGTDATGTSGEDVDLGRHVSGINVIASGHTHTPLSGARTVANGAWSTQIIDAGAFGTNVARIDLTYHRATKTTSVNASANPAMTDASLASIQAGLGADRFVAWLVRFTDHEINVQLAPLFAQLFPDYDRRLLAKGIYHVVGSTAQDMVSNDSDPAPAPNGLGDLAADADRAVTNAIIAQTFAAVGGNPANLPGYDFTPVQLGVVASGVLRGKLQTGVPLTFADIYNVLPLGITPDPTQALPLGFPLVSAYLDPVDLKKLAALQLLVQSDLAAADNYLNLSGIQYALKAAESYSYFKFATAAAVLQLTSRKAGGGSASAVQALGALARLGSDSGAALVAAYVGGNPYAAAIVKLNDPSVTPAQIGANLATIGVVASTAAADASAGTNTLTALLVSKAIAAIDTVGAFAASDASNTGIVSGLPDGVRVRAAADLYAIVALGSIKAQFGVDITAYRASTGPATLSTADFAGLLASRFDAAPATAGVQELKEWMALLSYLQAGLGGQVPPAYASTSNFTQFGSFGVAVKARNSSYPVAGIGQLLSTLGSLTAAP